MKSASATSIPQIEGLDQLAEMPAGARRFMGVYKSYEIPALVKAAEAIADRSQFCIAPDFGGFSIFRKPTDQSK